MDLKGIWRAGTALLGALLVWATGGAVGAAGCGDGEAPIAHGAGGSSAQTGSAAQGPLERFCGDRVWEETLSPAALGYGDGPYAGVVNQALKITVNGCEPDTTFPDLTGSVEGVRMIAPHPMRVHTLRAAFSGTTGTARLRLRPAYGRSYPGPCTYYQGGSCPDLSDASTDVIPPQDIVVTDPDPNVWVEVDVSSYAAVLEPTQHYFLVFEHIDDNLRLATQQLPKDQASSSTYYRPLQNVACGLGPIEYSLQVVGDTVCAWDEQDHWFASSPQPFVEDATARAAFVDLNGDGHDDVVTITAQPNAYFGDGKGAFTAASEPVFPAFPRPQFLAFGDLDNDGDQDAFVAIDAGHDEDADADGVTRLEGDCNDNPKASDSSADDIHPGAEEIRGNLRDDDCNGIADDGTAEQDEDGDGFSIADGDCDDTRDDVYPNAEELVDRRDNDCDGRAEQGHINRILLNDGAGWFSAVEGSGVEVLDHSYAVGFGDGNGDGNLDVFWGNWLLGYPYDPSAPDRYFEGNGDGTFEDAFSKAGLELDTPYSCYGTMWNDYNDDGHADIFVGNYHLYPNQLWQNQGDGTFADVAEQVGVHFDDIPPPLSVKLPGGHTYGGDFGDIDNDGDMDFFMANLAHPRTRTWSDTSMLFMNQGAPDYQFVDEREGSGIIYDEGDHNAAFADFDNDGDLDMVIGGAYPEHYSRLYRNEGVAADGRVKFADVTYETGTAVRNGTSLVWSDVDEDGDLDLLIAGSGPESYVNLLINRVGQDRNWVQFDLEGTGSNRSALGARVRLKAGDLAQMRDVNGPGGHRNNQHSRIVHFGLGDATAIDALEVRWIGGATETIGGAAPGGRYRIVEGTGVAVPVP